MSTGHSVWDRLDGLPRRLWRWSVICSAGQPAARLAHLPHWLSALHDGRLPDAQWHLGDPAAVAVLRAVVADLCLPELCRQRAAVVESLMQSVFWHLDSLIDRPPGQSRADAVQDMGEAFRLAWARERQGWETALSLLPTLGDERNARWDGLSGQWQRREWADLVRVAAVLERLPDLRRFLDGVGRSHAAPESPAPHASPSEATPTAAEAAGDADDRSPLPAEVDGVRHSRELARMAGGEALGLRHPVLHRLWRARFAEARLLTYDDRAPRPRPQPDPQPPRTAAEPHQSPRERGPMLLCLDTSGSMRGAPENVAKACVLQAVRLAQAQQRRCLLIAFGGPGELRTQALGHDAAGLAALLDTVGQAFDGGTDIQAPIEHAIERVRHGGWHDADVLIISDGEFGLTGQTLRELREAKKTLGLRVHGLLIGDRETIGLTETCDRLHGVRDWRRFALGAQGAAAEGFSPVHRPNLTALYFPNAIRHS